MIKGLLLLIALVASVQAQACKPIKVVMTRASGASAVYHNDTGRLEPRFPPSSVNMASVEGALKYVQSETIDHVTGYAQCRRKNDVAFIHFYEVEFCNSDESIKKFQQQFQEYGFFLTMDAGACHDNKYCSNLVKSGNPYMGPFVGFQDQTGDPRAPAKESYWYSLPGECPLKEWGQKSDECIENEPSGSCPEGMTPDGISCTWTAKLLGQVNLDELVGIKDIVNDATGSPFENSVEYCQAGNIEFRRHPQTYDFIEGLDFWRNPIDREANAQRVQKLLEMYNDVNRNPHNIAIPNVSGNPKCYETVRICGDGKEPLTRRCVRNSAQYCVPCGGEVECEVVPDDWKDHRFPDLYQR